MFLSASILPKPSPVFTSGAETILSVSPQPAAKTCLQSEEEPPSWTKPKHFCDHYNTIFTLSAHSLQQPFNLAKDDLVKDQEEKSQMLTRVMLDNSHPPPLLAVTLNMFSSSCNTVKVTVLVSLKINWEGK